MQVIDGDFGVVEKVEMTLEELRGIPGALGPIAAAVCNATGEYKCTVGGDRFWFVLKK